MPFDFVGRHFFCIFAPKISFNYRGQMKLKVNRKNIDVFEGAEVRHAILSYLAQKGMDVSLVDHLTVYDRWGHEIDLGAPASQFDAIKFKGKKVKK